ncbi:MAG: hypothetical protein MUD16_02710 [Desulfobacterales bacterium]|nr:hypothetical protein [Desulfobacterales bacterium]
MELGGQFDPRGAGSDDGDLERSNTGRLQTVSILQLQKPAQKHFMKPIGLIPAVQEKAAVFCSRDVEIVALSADRQDQRVVRHDGSGKDLPPSAADQRFKDNDLFGSVQADPLSGAEPEPVTPRQGQVVDRLDTRIQGPGRDLVQERLPHMRALRVNQRNRNLRRAPGFSTQADRKLESSRTASDEDDPMRNGAGHIVPTFLKPPG